MRRCTIGDMVGRCRVQGQADTFLTVEGPDTRNVVLGVNDLNRAKKVWEIQPDVPRGALRHAQQPVPAR
ncbi:MAG: hypothetical protein Q8Q12_04560 [bacterium]|nr:hypothetical protein [bacterium]